MLLVSLINQENVLLFAGKPLSPYALSERTPAPPAAEFQDPAIVAAGMPTSPRVIGGMEGGDMTWGAGAYPNARPPEEKPGFAATLQVSVLITRLY